MVDPDQRESIVSSKRSLDSICTEFEDALKSGKRIRIEAYTERARSGTSRTRLLQALLEIELEWVLKERVPQEDEYLIRFPEDVACVQKAFELFRQRYPQRFAKTLSNGEGETVVGVPSPQQPNVPLPFKFGRYVLQQRLGQGGMGQVFRAYDSELRRDVALKLPLLDSDDPNQIERFRGEARTAATIEHAGICQIYDIGEIDGQQFITMKLVDGKSLSDLLKEGKTFTTRQAVVLVRKVAEALAVAHEKGVIHRDIKPANIMLTSKGEPIVVDFGLAHQSTDSRSRLTQTGAPLGTPAYMPLEQANGDIRSINQRSDVYSLTAVLFRILSGETPYQGSPVAIIGQILTGKTPSLTDHRSDLDADLVRIVSKGMAYKQNDRYGTMQVLANELKEYVRKTAEQGNATQTARREAKTDNQPKTLVGASIDRGSGKRRWPVFVGAAFLFPLLFWLGTIIFVRTEHGTLRIEVLDPQLQVMVDGEVVTVKDGDRSLELKTGPKRLFIKSEELGLEFEKEFTLSKDAEKRLHVVLVNGKEIEVRDGPATTNSLDDTPSKSQTNIAQIEHMAKPTESAAQNLDHDPNLTVGSDSNNSSKSSVAVSQTATTNVHSSPANSPAPANAPFNAEQAKTHQEAWAKHLGVPIEYTNSIGMKFRLIPPGEFLMGMTELQAREALTSYPSNQAWEAQVLASCPSHRVRLTRAFYLSVCEVTQSQYERVIGTNPSYFPTATKHKENAVMANIGDLPVESVSFIDAQTFCNKLGRLENQKYTEAKSKNESSNWTTCAAVRLPTEAEWEFACRAGRQQLDEENQQGVALEELAWFMGNSELMTHPTGKLRRNEFGLHDMFGNVSEWCQDGYDPLASSVVINQVIENPLGPDVGLKRVVRGGSWDFGSTHCSSSLRIACDAKTVLRGGGFRVAVSVDTVGRGD